MRVRIPGNQGVRDLTVGKSVLHFGKEGYAEADHLSDAEIQRCIDFHFVVEGAGKQKTQAQVESPAAPALYGNQNDAADDSPSVEDERAPEDGGETAAKPRKPRAPRGSRSGKGAN